MIGITVAGATGRLGSMVCHLIGESEDMELRGAVVSAEGGHIGREIVPGVRAVGPDGLESAVRECDVYVDLTSPAAAANVISSIPAMGANIILGTTAVPQKKLDELAVNTAAEGTSTLVSANFAIGVNIFWKLCGKMAEMLPDYDIEVVEMHHNKKKDAPSGTAAEAVRRLQAASGIETVVYGREGTPGARKREIGVHSIRGGDVVGDHTVIFAGNMERLELTHRAESRETFARGCLEAIRWIAGKKDGSMHTMEEVLDRC